MTIYWTSKSIPELSSLPKNERRARWQKVYAKCFRHWQTWLGVIACGLLAAAASRFGDSFDIGILGATLGGGIGGGIGGLIFSQVVIRVARKHYLYILLGHTEQSNEKANA